MAQSSSNPTTRQSTNQKSGASNPTRNHRPVYIVDGTRTPFIKARGQPGSFTPVDLAVQCGRPLLLRQPIPADAFDQVILRCVNVLPEEVNPARIAALRMGKGEGKANKKDNVLSPPEDALDRLPMLNACVACIREKVVEDEEMADGAMIFGTGFAPFRGGPMKYARDRRFDVIRDKLASLTDRYGQQFQPGPGWQLLSARNK